MKRIGKMLRRVPRAEKAVDHRQVFSVFAGRLGRVLVPARRAEAGARRGGGR